MNNKAKVYAKVEKELGYEIPEGIVIGRGSKQAPIKQGMVKYFESRKPNEVDVHDLIVKAFKSLKMDNAIAAINNDPTLEHLTDRSSAVQRVLLNRHFKLTALKFTGKTHISTLPILREFFNDGDLETWLNRIYSQVIPFLNKHEVYKTLG